ncbi:MAG: hypothetical protein ACLQVI_03120 [Polyangiaceae bacterium]|jgi:hypothetical protein
MNAKRLFDDDDVLFTDPSNDRDSHVEIRIDGEEEEPGSTQPDLTAASVYVQRVPQLAVPAREVSLLPLDHREGFLLSLVDGVTSIETILDVCAMPADEALEILNSLVDRGVLVIPR